MRIFSLAVMLTVLLATNASADFVGTGFGGMIPDNTTVGLETSIVVNLAQNEVIEQVSVILVDFEHTWIGELNATLTGPGGSVDLFIRTGQLFDVGPGDDSDVDGLYSFADIGADWWDAAFSTGPASAIPQGIYAPSTTDGAAQSFEGTFAGTLTNGLWTLKITDNEFGDIGSIGSWNLSIRSTPIPEPTAFGFLAALCGIATIRRRKR